jgi:hypothetical protein
MSSIPSNFQPNTFSIGSSRLYVVQPVSLWNGTKSSPSLNVSFGNEFLSEVHGQTSPSDIPASDKRDGQMTESPVIRACQRAGLEQLSSPQKLSTDSPGNLTFEINTRRFWGSAGNSLTNNVTRPGIRSEKLGIGREGFREVNQ